MSTEWTERDSIGLSAALVAHDGHRMPLRGAERIVAIRMMARLGLSADVMAIRLCTNAEVISTAARRAGIRISREDLGWWLSICRPSQLRRRRGSVAA